MLLGPGQLMKYQYSVNSAKLKQVQLFPDVQYTSILPCVYLSASYLKAVSIISYMGRGLVTKIMHHWRVSYGFISALKI